MKKIITLFVFVVALYIASCAPKTSLALKKDDVSSFMNDANNLTSAIQSTRIPPSDDRMITIFENSFNNTDITNQGERFGYLSQSVADTSTVYNNWSMIAKNTYLKDCSIEYLGGDESMRNAHIATDPKDDNNSVFCFEIKHPNELMANGQYKSRVQTSMYRLKPLKEVKLSIRVFFPEKAFNILHQWESDITWLTLFEFWNDTDWRGEGVPFRISVNMVKNAGVEQDITFDIHGQNKANGLWKNVWKNTSEFALPFGKWITCDIYFNEGNQSEGRFIMEITPEGEERVVVCDITNWTYAPDNADTDGLTYLNPMKLYTNAAVVDRVRENGEVLQVLWDDFKLSGVLK